jgi:hypothetical protein
LIAEETFNEAAGDLGIILLVVDTASGASLIVVRDVELGKIGLLWALGTAKYVVITGLVVII